MSAAAHADATIAASLPIANDDDTLASTDAVAAPDSGDTLDQAFRALGRPRLPKHTRRYAFEQLLGRGGMGEVWLVGDQRLERAVALKRMRVQAAQPEQLGRFLREAQLSGSLEHPNIVPIYDLGVEADGSMFFTMKRLRGRSLEQLLTDKGAGSLLDRLDIFRKVCDAMAFAHAAGVIHRDLKPDNVMIGDFGEVMVLDWGLAKRLGERITLIDATAPAAAPGASAMPSDDGNSELTQDGALMGTPAFMAPEQARGQQQIIDTRTDIYALGVLLYVLLTGERPFSGPLATVLTKVMAGEFEPPGRRAKVPRELDAIVCKAMATQIDDRYPDVGSLRADVQAFLERRPVSVVHYSAIQRLRKWTARNRSLVAAVVGTGGLGLAALLASGLVYLRDVSSARDRAEQARQEAIVARDEATAARDLATVARDRAEQAEREALLRAADAEVALALALAQGGDYVEAITHLGRARQGYRDADASTLEVDLVHAWVDGENPPPLLRYAVPEGASVVAVSPDSRRLAWTLEQRVVIDDWISGERLFDAQLPELMPRSIAARADDFIVLERSDGALQVRALLGEVEPVRLPDSERVRMCADGHAVLLEQDGAQRLWSLDAGTPLGPAFVCGTLHSFSADCARVLCDPERRPNYEVGGRVELWDARQGRELQRFPGGNSRSLSPDGSLVAISQEHRGLTIYSSSDGKQLWRDEASERTGFGLFASDNARIYSFTPDRWLYWWSRDGQLLGRRRLEGAIVGSHIGSPFVIVSSGTELTISTDGPGAHAPIELPPGRAVATSPAELLGVAAGEVVTLFDPLTGAVLEQLASPSASNNAVALDGRGHAVLLSPRDGAWSYDLRRGPTPISTLAPAPDDASRATTLALLPGRDEVIIGHVDGLLRRWDYSRELVVREYRVDQYPWQLEPSADGRLLYIAGRLEGKPGCLVLDLDSGALTFSSTELGPAYAVSLSDDGRMFGIGPHRGEIPIWMVGGSEAIARLPELGEPLMGLDFSPDGQLLAGHAYTGRLLLWDARDWSLLQSLPFSLPGLAFAADGRSLHGAGRRFDFDLANEGERLRLGFPRIEAQTVAERFDSLLAGLVLQQDWEAAAHVIAEARREQLPVPELLAARVAWKLGDVEGARSALQRARSAGAAQGDELEVWQRVLANVER